MTSASTSRRRAQFIAQGLTWKGTTRETIWTPQLQTQLDKILNESPNLSFSQIAAQLGLTKNQVIGRVDRMKGIRPRIKRERRRDRDVPYKKAPKEIVPTTLERLDALNFQFTQFLSETELPRELKYQSKGTKMRNADQTQTTTTESWSERPHSTKSRCQGCDGRGWRFSLPHRINPFEVRLPTLAAMMRRVVCWECKGNGAQCPSEPNPFAAPP